MASEEKIRRLCEQFYAETLSASREERRKWRARGWDDDVTPAEEAFEAAGVGHELADDEAERMAAGDRRSVVDDARRLAQEAGLAAEGDEFDALQFELQRTLIRAYRDCAREWEADLTGSPRMTESAGVLSPTGSGLFSTVSTVGGGKSLAEAVEAFLSDGKERRRWAAKTYDETARVLGWFVQWVGADKPIDAVARDDCRTFEDALSKLPAGLPKDAKLRLEIERAGKDRERLSPSGQAKYRGRVVAFFHFAIGESWIVTSPMRGVKRREIGTRGGPNSYEPFTDEELTRIFTADYRIEAGADANAATYWLPLIALYTGARRGEVAQLQVRDVREAEGGVWSFYFTAEGEEQSVKTESSRRVVPVHSQLVELGLPAFVEKRRKASGAKGTALLFREVRQTKNGWGDREGRRFARWLDRVEISDPSKVFHSFRHTVSNRLKRQGVEEYLIAAVVGHANESMTTGRYGGKLEARDLVPVVERLDFRGPLAALFEGARGGRRQSAR